MGVHWGKGKSESKFELLLQYAVAVEAYSREVMTRAT
jgi:hypothetical protein